MSRTHLVPDSGPVLPLREALYCACRDYRGGITAVALSIGADPAALSRSLRPTDSRPVQPELLEAIVAVTGDPRLLAALVRPAGVLAVVPRPVGGLLDGLQALGEVLAEKARFVSALHAGLADGVLDGTEVAALRYHADQLIGQLLGIVAGAEHGEVCHAA